MTDKENVLRAIDDGPWLHLLALADILEEEGKEWWAKAIRWLVKTRRRPAQRIKRFYWNPKLYEWNMRDNERVTRVISKKYPMRTPHTAPVVYDAKKTTFATESEAWLWAAESLGEAMRVVSWKEPE